MAQGWYFCQGEFKQYETKIIAWNSAAKHTLFFPSPPNPGDLSSQLRDASIQESFGKISNIIKNKAVSSLHCLQFDYTKRSSNKKKLCTFKGLEGTAEVVYHWNTDLISIDLFSFSSWHQCPVWISWGPHNQNKQNSDTYCYGKKHINCWDPWFL